MEVNTLAIGIFDMPSYFFFSVVGGVFALSLFIVLLLNYNFSIPLYTRIFFLSGIGLLIGGRLFGILSAVYTALANNYEISLSVFLSSGFVFYGGLFGFLLAFIAICKLLQKRNKQINYGVMDLVAVCIPLFHFWGRLGCFFGGCCYGIESSSIFSVVYTNYIIGEIVTASRLPVQLFEAAINLLLFVSLLILLKAGKFKGHLLKVYLVAYAAIRIILEFFRGDVFRGVWNGVSFSQVVSVVILICVIVNIAVNNKKQSEGTT